MIISDGAGLEISRSSDFYRSLGVFRSRTPHKIGVFCTLKPHSEQAPGNLQYRSR